MMTKDDGGPAFPITPPICGDGHSPAGYPYPNSGMSLRDWFAGMAMQGMAPLFAAEGAESIAVWAYQQADAMLRERAK